MRWVKYGDKSDFPRACSGLKKNKPHSARGSGAVGAARSARVPVNKSAPAGTGSLEREIMLQIIAKQLGCSIDDLDPPKGAAPEGQPERPPLSSLSKGK
jgi:hypothetical protein